MMLDNYVLDFDYPQDTRVQDHKLKESRLRAAHSGAKSRISGQYIKYTRRFKIRHISRI